MRHSSGIGTSPVKERILKPNPLKSGYYRVSISIPGNKEIKPLIHRLVAKTFLSNYSDNLQVNHKNGIKNDNKMGNLEMCTQYENQRHLHRELQPRKRGVCWHKHVKAWQTRINYNGKLLHLGYFTNKEKAYKVFYKKYIELFEVTPW